MFSQILVQWTTVVANIYAQQQKMVRRAAAKMVFGWEQTTNHA